MEKQSELEVVLSKKSIKALVAFAIPVLFMLLLYYGVGIYPYKSKTVLTSDLSGQYVNYFASLKDIVLSHRGFFYSFSKTLGGDMPGMVAYYLLSPLNVLFILVEKNDLPFVLMLVTLTKIGLSGSFFSILLGEKSEYYYRNIIFSTAYALSGYSIAFAFNLMWMDTVVLIPLVIWAVERIFNEKNTIPYVITLFLLVVSCYYTGYMGCIFVAMYVVYRIISGEERAKIKVKSLIKIGFTTLVSLGMTALVLIPAVTSQNTSRSIGGKFEISTKCQISAMEFFNGLFSFNGSHYTIEDNLPYVFYTVPLLFFAVAFYFNTQIKIREKIIVFLISTSFVLSTMFVTADAVWHGFASPNQFYYRYTFLFIFIAIISAWRCYENLDGLKKPVVIILPMLTVLGMMAACIITVKGGITLTAIIINTVLIIITAYLAFKTTHMDEVLVPIVRILLFIAVTASILFQGNEKMFSTKFADNSLSGYLDEMEPCINYIKDYDKGFYRTEKTFVNSLNDPMLLNYYGLSHFSSSDSEDIMNLMEYSGYTRNQYFWSYYNQGSTLGMDSYYGVKYILSRKQLDKKLKQIAKYENINIYENDNALGIIFAGYGTQNSVEKNNVFEYVNRIYKSITDLDEDIYTKMENIEVIKESETKVHYCFRPLNDQYFYMAMPLNRNPSLMEVKVNDKDIGEYYDTYNRGVLSLGSYKLGNVVDVTIDYKGGEVIEPLIYSENAELLKTYTTQINKSTKSVKLLTDSHIKAEIELDKHGRILTTIPYSENWKAKLDGKEVTIDTHQNCLIALNDVKEGKHKLELKYVPANLKISLVISGISLAIFILMIVVIVSKKIKDR